MNLFDLKTLAIVVTALLFFSVLIRLYRTRNEKHLLVKELQLSSAELKKVHEEKNALAHQLKQLNDFQENLKEAELTTKFQRTRLNETVNRMDPDSPERYHYIQTLAQKGLPPEEIASILKISIQEIEQVLSLSQLANK